MGSTFHIRSFISTLDADWYDKGFHQNDTLEIEIVLEGRGLFEWGEPEHQQYIEAGHVVVIPPGVYHRFEAVSKIRLGVIHLGGLQRGLQTLVDRFLSTPTEPGISALSPIDRDRFTQLFREWLRIQSSNLRDKSRHQTVWTEVLLLFLYEHSQSDLQAMTITKAADYIRNHLREHVQITELAELTGLTVSGFRRMFERIYGISPKQYQQQCRMQEAKWLLSTTEKDINEISEEIGFHRMHSFSQWFKSIEGLPPSLWRKKQKMLENSGHFPQAPFE